MDLYQKIKDYKPWNEQEENDKRVMLRFIKDNEDCLLRTNKVAHFTASAWAVNQDRSKVLMIYHNIYDSWSWTGGHADGENDLAQVAIRELKEETGILHCRLIISDIFSLETIVVDGHEKRDEYVPSHLHMNLTYLIEVDEEDSLSMKIDENSGVKWFAPQDALEACSEPWMINRVYQKLLDKMKEI